MKSKRMLDPHATTFAIVGAAFSLLTIFAAPARAQVILSPDKIVIRCHNGACTGGTATLTNAGNSEVTIYGISIGGLRGFSETNNCGSALAPGAFCSIIITIAPGSGNSTGVLAVDDNAPNGPQKALIRVIGNSGS
jgi:hypothetical protein